jgi:hypothetical protein
LHASATPDARVAIDVDDSVGTFEKRVNRANVYARRFRALVAPQHRKVSPDLRIFSSLGVFHPRAEGADRHVVFLFASDGARVAADALFLVDDEAVLQLRLKFGVAG